MLSFFNPKTTTTDSYTLSLHDALPISQLLNELDCLEPTSFPGFLRACGIRCPTSEQYGRPSARSEEHTSELQSRFELVCRLLLEKKKESQLAHDRMPPSQAVAFHQLVG